ncbi:MAG: hypothetical protein K0S54_450 [Alphaproteobacteria bacterium]|jgi:hypothetical protein|nr:hypothetical protein [Alphaproteobacteria bacterium]
MASQEYIDYLKTINSTFYDQIKAADQKAAYILTFLFVLLIWSSDMRQVFFWVNVDKGLSVRWVMSLGQVLALGVALVCAILVLLPRDAHGGVALYWNAWPQAREVVAKAMQADDRDFLVEQYLANVVSLATICRKKYRMVALAFQGLIAALAFHVVTLAAA